MTSPGPPQSNKHTPISKPCHQLSNDSGYITKYLIPPSPNHSTHIPSRPETHSMNASNLRTPTTSTHMRYYSYYFFFIRFIFYVYLSNFLFFACSHCFVSTSAEQLAAVAYISALPHQFENSFVSPISIRIQKDRRRRRCSCSTTSYTTQLPPTFSTTFSIHTQSNQPAPTRN